MTVGELKEMLVDYDEDATVLISLTTDDIDRLYRMEDDYVNIELEVVNPDRSPGFFQLALVEVEDE